jgi:hypothetical protein
LRIERIEAEANWKRSEAAKAQENRGNQYTKPSKKVEVVQQCVAPPPKKERPNAKNKATESKTNLGAVQRGDQLYNSLKTRDAANPGFKEGNEGGPGRGNKTEVQNDPQFNEQLSAAKQVATAHGVSEKKAKREGRLNEKIAEHGLKGVPRGETENIHRSDLPPREEEGGV